MKDNNFYRIIGAKGGKAKVKKGFATMNPERLKEISQKAAKSRHANKDRQSRPELQSVGEDEG